MADVNFTAQERSSCQNNALCVENLSISRLNVGQIESAARAQQDL